jgi:hypothetical protein
VSGSAASTSDRATDAPHCSDFARAERLDPAGSAGSYHHIAVVELPLPWPHDIADHPEVAPVADALAGAGVRVQAVVPQSDGSSAAYPNDTHSPSTQAPGTHTPGTQRLIHFWRPPGPFHAYGRTEHAITTGELPAALATLAAEAAPTAASDRAPHSQNGTRPSDALVCSHGRRDACCGMHGTRLANRLSLPGIRVWRTSHTGGHRFAPTAMVLPEGTLWAYLDDDLLEGILTRTLDIAVAAGLYRGCTGLDHPAVQAAEREILRERGWSWFEHARTGGVVDETEGRTHVRLDYVAPDGSRGAFDATVEVARILPVPDCRRPLGEARKTAPEFTVTELRARP